MQDQVTFAEILIIFKEEKVIWVYLGLIVGKKAAILEPPRGGELNG